MTGAYQVETNAAKTGVALIPGSHSCLDQSSPSGPTCTDDLSDCGARFGIRMHSP